MGPRHFAAYLLVMLAASLFGIAWGLQRGGVTGNFVVGCAVVALLLVAYLYWAVIHKNRRR